MAEQSIQFVSKTCLGKLIGPSVHFWLKASNNHWSFVREFESPSLEHTHFEPHNRLLKQQLCSDFCCWLKLLVMKSTCFAFS